MCSSDLVEERTVGPDLGADSIHSGILASAIAVTAVVVFMLVTYGRFGVYANLAVIINVVVIVGVLAVTVVMNLAVFQYQQILSVFARDILHIDAFGFGLLSAADALGSTIGIVLLAQRPKAPQAAVFVGSCVGMCLLLTGFTFVTAFPLALVTLLCFGIVHAGFSTMQSSIILRAAAADVRGRAGGWLSMAIGTLPFGMVLLGVLAEQIGSHAAVVASAVAGMVVLVLWLIRRPEVLRLA